MGSRPALLIVDVTNGFTDPPFFKAFRPRAPSAFEGRDKVGYDPGGDLSRGRPMGIHFKIDTEACVIFATREGEVGMSDFQNLRMDYSAHPKYQPGLDLLIDARSAKFSLTGGEARQLARFRVDNPLAERLRVVGKISFGFIRMFQGWVGDDPNTQVFKDMKSARKWLGWPMEEE